MQIQGGKSVAPLRLKWYRFTSLVQVEQRQKVLEGSALLKEKKTTTKGIQCQ